MKKSGGNSQVSSLGSWVDGDAVNGHPEIEEGGKERFEEGTMRRGWKHAALVLPTGWTDEYLGHQDKLGHGATDIKVIGPGSHELR